MKTLIVATLIFASTVTQAQTDRSAAFRETYLKEVKDAGVVGSGFVFVKDGKVIAHHSYGMANVAKNQAVDADTIWHWASNTKPFTGIAIMQLRDRGLLDLDDPVTKYLPELREVHNRFGSMDTITNLVANLATQIPASFFSGVLSRNSRARITKFISTRTSSVRSRCTGAISTRRRRTC